MTENNETPTPPSTPPPSDPPETPAPPPPPDAAPPPPAAAPTGDGGQRGLMIALSYLGILALIPLLVEKEDGEIQWHAKHGLVLLGAEFCLFVVLSILSLVPMAGCLFSLLIPLVGLGILALHIVCIIKGVNGERFLIPGLSELADKF